MAPLHRPLLLKGYGAASSTIAVTAYRSITKNANSYTIERASSCPNLAHDTIPSWCGTRTAGETSRQRSCSTAFVGSADDLQSRPPGYRVGPNHGGPAPRP